MMIGFDFACRDVRSYVSTKAIFKQPAYNQSPECSK